MKIFTKVQNKTAVSVNKYLSLPLLLFVFCTLFSLRLGAQAPLKVIVPDVTVSCNDTTVLAVTVQGFDSILAAKFALLWDTSELKFVSLSKLNSTLNLSLQGNFGPGINAWKQGKHLIFLYNEPTLNGISLPNNDTLFLLKFIATDTIGQITHIIKEDVEDDVIKINGIPEVLFIGGNVLLKDIVPPVITCPSNLTVSTAPGANTAILSGSGSPTASDNCDQSLDISYYITGATQLNGNGNANGSTLNIGQHVIHYVAKDDDNNKDTCTFNVQVNFTPGNNSSTDTVNFIIPNKSADCNNNVDVPITVENFKGIASTKLTIIWNKTNLNYQSIIYRNPKLGIQNSDFTLNSNSDSLTLLWTDSGGNIDTLNNGDTLFVVRYLAKASNSIAFSNNFDVAGGSPLAQITKIKSKNGFVTVSDITAPTIVCPSDVSVTTSTNSAIVSGLMASANDNCSLPTIAYQISGSTTLNGNGDASGSSFNVGTSSITYTATDLAGLKKSCSLNVVVTKLVNNQDIIINIGSVTANCKDTITIPISVDNFSNVLSAQFGINWNPNVLKFVGNPINLNSNLPIVLSEINYDQSLVVNGKINVSWADLQNTGKSLSNGSVLFSLKFIATGNGNISIDTNQNATPKLEIAGGTPIINYKVKVNNGLINVVDNIAPSINCPANLTVTALPQTQKAVLSNIDPNFSDNCSIPTLNYSVSGSTSSSGNGVPTNVSFNIGTSNIVYTATDANNNSKSCTFSVLVNKPESTPMFTIGNVSGNCGDTVCVPIKVNNFVDVVSAQFTINWNINDLKFISAENLNSNLPVTNAELGVDNSFTSNGFMTFSWFSSTGLGDTLNENESLFCLKFVIKGGFDKIPVKFDLTDNAPTKIEITKGFPPEAVIYNVVNGNVTISDNNPPVITCRADTTIHILKNMAPIVVNGLDPTYSDNCFNPLLEYYLNGATVSSGLGTASGKLFKLGATNVLYNITDAGGNTAACGFNVTIVEDKVPTNFTLGLKSNSGNCKDSLIAIDVLGFKFDSIVSIQYTLVWDTTVLKFVKSGNYNSSINFDENNIYINNNVLTSSWSDNNPKTLSNGSVIYTLYFKPVGNYGSYGDIKFDTTSGVLTPLEVARVTFTNIIPADFINSKVFISDTVPPVITCPSNKIVKANYQQNSVVVNNINPTISDDCSSTSSTFVVSGSTTNSGNGSASGELFNVGISTVTYTAIDEAGNSTSCSFIVTVKQLPSTNFSILTTSATAECDQANLVIPIRVLNFDSIVSAQFTLMYDTSILKLVTVNGLNNTMNVNDTNFVSYPNLGKVTFAWNGLDALNQLTLNLPDSSIIFNLNFEVNKAKSGSNTLVMVDTSSSAITELEVAQGSKLKIIPVDLFNGTINVIDTVKPIITCPSNVKQFNPIVNGLAPTTLDNCKVKNVTYSISGATTGNGNSDASGTSFNNGYSNVTYTVFDNANNSASCTFQVRVGPDTLYLNVNGDTANCGDFVNIYLTTRNFVEVTSISSDVQWDNSILEFVSYTRNPLFDAVDFSNTSNAVKLNRISNIPLNLNNGDTIVSIKLNVLKGGVSPINILNSNALAFGTPPISYVIVTQNNQVQIVDTLKPVISNCPSNIKVQLATCDTAITWTSPVATDNCGIKSFETNYVPGDRFEAGIYEVIYNAEDVSGLVDTCKFTITVVDTIPPVLQNCVIGGLIAFTPKDTCGAVVNWNTISATDECSKGLIVTSNYQPNTLFNIGATVVIYTATDAQGNTSTCSFSVVVLDNKAPSFVTDCPKDTTVFTDQGTCSTNVTWIMPTAFDNCSGNQVVVTSDSINGQKFSSGVHTVTIFAQDTVTPNGNVTSCKFRITVKDREAPIILSCVKDTTITAPLGSCDAIFSWNDPIAIDNCDNSLTFTSDSLKGGVFTSGIHKITIFATDDDLNVTSCSFNLKVIGNVPPVFVDCPANIVVTTNSADCKMPVNFLLPTVIGSCNDISTDLLYTHLPNDTFNVGITTVTLVALASNGLTDTCIFTIQVKDQVKPQITNCPSNQIIVLNSNQCDTAYVLPAIDAVDNCDKNLVITTSTNPSLNNGKFGIGSTIVNVTVSDNSGNQDSCKYSVEVKEVVKPTITNCPADITVTAFPSSCKGLAAWQSITATDNCDNAVKIVSNINVGDTLNLVKTPIIVVATDFSGNTDTCRFNIIVNGTIPPTFTKCPTDITASSDPITCAAIVGWELPEAVSNCNGTITYKSSHNPNSYFPLGTTMVTYVAKDLSGDSSICKFNVTVIDNTKPVITGCPTDTLKLYVTGTCDAVGNWVEPQALDNCSSVKITSNIKPPAVFYLGNTEIIYVATDSLNNTDTCRFIVTVLDTISPYINGCPQDITVYYDVNAGGGVPTWTPPTITDNCSGFIVSSNYNPGDTLPCYDTQVIYTGIDSSGNKSICTFNVHVSDTIPPTIANCPKDLTINAIQDTCLGILNWTPPSFYDNCTINLKIIANLEPGDTVGIGLHPITYTVMDSSGNISICKFNVSVVESIAPTITCPKPIIVTQDGRIISDSSKVIISTVQNSNCKEVQINFFEPSGSDNCGVDTTFALGLLKSGGNFPIGDTFILYRVYDLSGNFATCRFDIKVLPIEPPNISSSDTIVCEGNMFQLFADSIKGTNATFNWFGPGFTSNAQNPIITNMTINKTGYYFAQTNINGCLSKFSDSLYIDILTNPIASPDSDTITNKGKVDVIVISNDIIRAGYKHTLTIVTPPVHGTATILNDSTIQYMPTDSFYIGLDVFTYKLCYEDCPNLCTEAIVTINVKTNVPGCPVPTVITPNDDGSNDLLVIPCLTGKEQSEIIIFNEWGDKVFQAAPYYQNWWNGTYKNQPVPDGTYYYIFFEDKSDATKTAQKGYITVFR